MDGATVVTIDETAGRLARASETFRRVDAALRAQDPDVVLLDCFEIPGVVTVLLARRHDVPVVARLVGDFWEGYRNAMPDSVRSLSDATRYAVSGGSLLLNQFVFRQAAGFVTVSTELQSAVRANTGSSPDRIGVVPVPFTTDPLQTGSATRGRETLGVDEKQVLLTVTNLQFREKRRGVATAVSELRPLLQREDDLAYVVAGDGRHHGPLLDDIDDLVDDPAVRDRIYAPGFVDDVADLYALADVFVYVSYRDGYPNAVLEAQTAQLPVVANDAHGMRDQITDGETGYLVDPTASGALRERVGYLLQCPEDRQRIGASARARVLRDNAPSTVSARMEDVLSRLVPADR